MSKYLNNPLYRDDIEKVANQTLPWEKLRDKSVLICGATGLIGSFLVDVLMYKNTYHNLNCTVLATGRNMQRGKERFARYLNNVLFRFLAVDINGNFDIEKNVHYIVHLASNTHPIAYATDPVGTILTNIIGTDNLLRLAVEKKVQRFLFASSVEIYGENRGDCELFDERYCGYIDCNTLRAGYPEGKRAGEALCQAYIQQYGLDIVITRLARTYGATVLATDTKAISQFIQKGVKGENIVLKSEGNQLYSYSYVADAVSALLVCLFNGVCGEAYNVADAASNITLKELATLIADYVGTKVVFELPSKTESTGYSKATKAIMSEKKIKEIGWFPMYSMGEGIRRTIKMLKD